MSGSLQITDFVAEQESNPSQIVAVWSGKSQISAGSSYRYDGYVILSAKINFGNRWSSLLVPVTCHVSPSFNSIFHEDLCFSDLKVFAENVQTISASRRLTCFLVLTRPGLSST